MNNKKVAILADCEIEEIKSFIDGFSKESGCEIESIARINNGARG